MGSGSADAEQRALGGPVEREVDILQDPRGERGRLPPFDNRAYNIRRKARQSCKLAEARAASTMGRSDGSDRLIRVRKEDLPSLMRFGDQGNELLIA